MRLTIEKPVYGGDCLAHVEGKAVFVPLVLPGETVSAKIVEEKRNFAKAEAEEILTASAYRVSPPCPHFGVCGGCHYQHADYPAQLDMKEQILRETLQRAGVAVSAAIGRLFSDLWAYRNRIRLAFAADGQFGYRGRRSHEIVPIRECRIAAPVLLEAADAVRKFLQERTSPAAISEMELFANADGSDLLITLFCEGASNGDSEGWLASLQASLPEYVVGIRMQVADGALVPQILAEMGRHSLTYAVAGFGYRVDNGAFFQINRRLVDEFVARVTSGHAVPLAWDLYAGVGLFARQLAATCERVIAVEVAPASLTAIEQNLAGTTSRAIGMTTLDFLRRNREEREPRPDLIVMDPPRAGLGEETTTLLNAIHAPEMVYVSCDPATLARDLRALTRERYRIAEITLVDMFPQTFHMETIVRLVRT
jgi:23S rRNA (uracil1939-C5)-methyltransferase